MSESIIRRTITRLMVPFIQLFALYVIVHGDSGPGGGFQGGVILGASFILYAIVFGSEAGRKRAPRAVTDILASTGALIYAGIGLLCLLLGSAFLDYRALPFEDPHLAGHYGILGIEIGVGMTVAAVMVTIFFETARRNDEGEVENG